MSKFNKISSATMLCACLFLAGCSSNKNVVSDLETQRRAPDEALKPCKKIEKLNNGSFSEVVLKLQEVMKEYKTCDEKRSALASFIENK